jgi:twitching motility protein PilT
VDLINRKRSEHIITLEDPVEYVFEARRSQISQREIGSHTQDFASALRAALREDPDVIVVGELRDPETTSLAVTAAETGHLVFATLHTTGAGQTIYRLLDFFPPKQRNQVRSMISESMRGIVCQKLIPSVQGKRMALATEIMFNIPSIANLIREEKIYQLPNVIQISKHAGMQVMDESILELMHAGRISREEAFFAAVQKGRFQAKEEETEDRPSSSNPVSV